MLANTISIDVGHQADGSFTGAFVGMAASDCNGEAKTAKFDYFVYRPGMHSSPATIGRKDAPLIPNL